LLLQHQPYSIKILLLGIFWFCKSKFANPIIVCNTALQDHSFSQYLRVNVETVIVIMDTIYKVEV